MGIPLKFESHTVEFLEQLVKDNENNPNLTFNLCNLKIKDTNLFCLKNKKIKRIDMPQLSGTPIPGTLAEKLKKPDSDEVKAEEFFAAYLESRHKFNDLITKQLGNTQEIKNLVDKMTFPKQFHKIEEKNIEVTQLNATQNQQVDQKVIGMYGVQKQGKNDPRYFKILAPIFISQDNYVLDGHHRWAAQVVFEIADGKNDRITISVNQIDQNIDELVDLANTFAKEFGIASKGARAKKPAINNNSGKEPKKHDTK